jgi:serine/threonine protein phosphatase PrpC
MKPTLRRVRLQAAFITDRGLNQKRPLNEDALLADPERGIFAVADGVGGSEAGEVASQTAVEVIGQAFQELDGADIEDVMELAIQRANNSIYQMAREQPRFSMMATTIVALHVDGNRATIGHVGDSRLYRLSSDGSLFRETVDHSVVEEEVQAGRMTPDQAAHHPSRNVISRALGAEAGVEVDLKTIEVEDGTSFLLCSDGITRHISDLELRELLTSGQELEAICAEMKRFCYERGAEDNLTAIVVQLGTPALVLDNERTISISRHEVISDAPGDAHSEAPQIQPTRIAFTAAAAPADQNVPQEVITTAQSKRGKSRTGLRWFVLLLLMGAVAAAFYGGMYYQKRRSSVPVPPVTTGVTAMDKSAELERKRSDVDADPEQWLARNLPIQMSKEGISSAKESRDPEFLYLYGRAQMLIGDHHAAMQAFELALANTTTEEKRKLPLDVEIRIAEAVAALKQNNKPGAAKMAMRMLDEVLGLRNEGQRPGR